ncbi:ABC transporter transmembrane domain-containing protein [Afifella sp. JA880]|uniref:ABC transporter transmembrane domain-containing protein n=1 Tax=Afifella sp. JA880 TaxID=2975280 RepID=UPI0021BA82DC|nr:ABC transporter transmembrane domain-containing protein [Afifella sp. JA880]MCT8268134.1 ABC transporter transmembrane domain-containing protein [Afifella sp. JA880]
MTDRSSKRPRKAGRSSLRPLKALVPYFARYRGRVAATLAALILATLATLAIPMAVRRVVDFGFSADNAGFIDSYFTMLLVVVAVLAGASAARFYLVTTLGERIVADLRDGLFTRMMQLSAGFYDTARSGEILSRLTADTTQIRAAISFAASVALRNIMMFLGSVVMMVVTSPGLSALVLAAIPFIVVPILWFGRRVRQRSRFAQDRLAEASAYASEAISGVRTVQAFNQETPARRYFGVRIEDAFQAARSATAARAALTAFAIFIVFASVVVVLWWGAQAVVDGTMTGGRLSQFVLYSVFAAAGLGEIGQVWGEISQAAGATERIVELLETEPEIKKPQNPVALPTPARGEVRFDELSFAYPQGSGPVLHNVAFDIRAGERVAIVGPSGAGKSTVFALLMRFYDPQTGSVMVDGVPITEADPEEVRRRIALVPQDVAIFAATAFDNIRFGNETASREDVEAAAKAANADEFIRALPEGYDTVLGERGITLSGGQKQRIAIARALLKDAPILLLDEATSSLDAESEVAVQAALETLMKDRTSLVIAHRLATVRNADRILVMENGALVEEGTHQALISKSGLYARLAELQFNDGGREPESAAAE